MILIIIQIFYILGINRLYIMIPTIDETKEIIKKTQHINIDVKETILKTISSEWMEENYFVSSLDGDYLFDLMEFEEVEYNFLSDEYFDYINSKISEEGIYIALAYACGECAGDNVIYYETGNLDEDDIEYTGICTWKEDVTLAFPYDKYCVGDMVTDYGIVVYKTGNEYTIDYSFNDNITFGHSMGYRKISSIEHKLNEPLHRMLIKLISEAIIKDNE